MTTDDKSTASVRTTTKLKAENGFLRKEQQRLEDEVQNLRTLLDMAREDTGKAYEYAQNARRYAIVLAQLAASAHVMLDAGETTLAVGILSTAQTVETAMLVWKAVPRG